jgi:hypothetical protein
MIAALKSDLSGAAARFNFPPERTVHVLRSGR